MVFFNIRNISVSEGYAASIMMVASVIGFWIVRDVGSVIGAGEGGVVSDLSRYALAYSNVSFDKVLFLSYSADAGYYWTTLVFSSIGISFEAFLISLLLLYYYSFMRVFHELTLCKSWYVHFFVMLVLSLWLIPLITVVLRQGVALLVLVFFLFRIEVFSLLRRVLVVLFAASFHFSAIMFVPYVIFERFMVLRIKLVDAAFVVVFLLYVSGYLSLLSSIIADLIVGAGINIRALSNNSSGYQNGFSIYKGLAIAVPALLFRLSVFSDKHTSMLGVRIYAFYAYSAVLGMFLSGLPYHDRIMLYAWGVSPILMGSFMLFFLVWMSRMSAKTLP